MDPHQFDCLLTSLAETDRLGRLLGEALDQALPAHAVVLLFGDMGSGKTTLAKAVCEGLGIAPEQVISPTYTLVNIYPGPVSVYHVDFFRTEHPEDLLDLDRADWINPAGPTLIEWPDVARPLLAGDAVLEAKLEWVRGAPQQRGLTLSGGLALYGAVFAALSAPVLASPGAGDSPRG